MNPTPAAPANPTPTRWSSWLPARSGPVLGSSTLSLAFLFMILLAVSFVQFAGTYSTCKIWHEGREEAYECR